MKFFIFIIVLLSGFHGAMADASQPVLVHAVVCELKLTPNSLPDGGAMITGSPPVWEAILVIDKVLHGPEDLKSMEMHTLTAALPPQGNTRVVTPMLNVGDAGIWAIKHVADGTLFEVYSPYEVEKGVYLPLIKGRHDAYKKVLSRLSGTAALPNKDEMPEASQQNATVISSSTSITSEANPTQAPQATAPSSPTAAETKSSSGFPIVPVAIIGALIVGIVLYLLRRKSP